MLALQGDFHEHIQKIEELGHGAIEIRRANELGRIDGLIIPGGESTTIAKLENVTSELKTAPSDSLPIFDAIKLEIENGMPVWGTCMGSIILAKEIEGSKQGRIGLMDITVRRNAFGPQRASSQIDLNIEAIGTPSYPCIFIRAPLFIHSGKDVEIFCQYNDGFVMAAEKNMLVSAFHPELTTDLRVHKYFLGML